MRVDGNIKFFSGLFFRTVLSGPDLYNIPR